MSRPRAHEPAAAARPSGRRRTALSQPPAEVRRSGDPELAELLAQALEGAGEDPDRWTHGFHVYPARMHPAIAARLADRFAEPGTTVLDPFCGSGTVLLEVMARGAQGIGIDLNPLALRLAALKCTRLVAPGRQRVLEAAHAVFDRTMEGVRARVDIRAPLPAEERRFWEPHVLRELAVLQHEILALADPFEREVLLFVLSSLVVKFSRQRADTSPEVAERRIGKGVPTRFFARKAEELVERFAELDAALPRNAPAPKLRLLDARGMIGTVGKRSVDAVITSPPYVGTYDYAEHHARRWAWLGINPGPLRRGEIGARRDYADVGAAARWDHDIARVLAGVAHVLVQGGWSLWLVGDGEIGGRRVPADVQLAELGAKVGLVSVAVASQQRPDWRGGAERYEHLVALQARGELKGRAPAAVSAEPAPRRSPPRAHRGRSRTSGR